MAYNLNPSVVDEMVLKGNFVSTGKSWAHVLHGQRATLGAAVTSTQLLSKAESLWHSGGVPNDQYMSSDVQLLEIDVKQIVGYKSRYGRVTQLGITIAGGVITAVAILDPGVGYINGGDFALIYDLAGPGSGAVISLTYAGGICTAAAVVAGGSGYSANTYATAPIPDAVAGNRYDYLYGAADFLGGLTDVGQIATDREPSFNAFSIRMRSSLPGRHGRGAAHWPGVAEAQTTGDYLNAPDIANIQPRVTAWFVTPWGGALPNDWPRQIVSPTIMHRIPPNLIPTTNAFWLAPISTATLNRAVGSMLRRKVKV